MRRGTLHFAQDGNLLVLLGDQQLVAVPDGHVVGHAFGSFDHAPDIYHEAADGLGIAQLAHQLLTDLQTLGRAVGGPPALIGGTAADDGLER